MGNGFIVALGIFDLEAIVQSRIVPVLMCSRLHFCDIEHYFEIKIICIFLICYPLKGRASPKNSVF